MSKSGSGAAAVSFEAVCASEVSGVYAAALGLSKPKIKKLKACSKGQARCFCRAYPIWVQYRNIWELCGLCLCFLWFGPIQVIELWIKPFPKGTWINLRCLDAEYLSACTKGNVS